MEHEAGSIFNILAASKNGAGKIHNTKKESIEKRYQDYKNMYLVEEEVIEVQEQKDETEVKEVVVVPVKTVVKKKTTTSEQFSGNARLSKKERRDLKKNKD